VRETRAGRIAAFRRCTCTVLTSNQLRVRLDVVVTAGCAVIEFVTLFVVEATIGL
jgi:hypothetical protein